MTTRRKLSDSEQRRVDLEASNTALENAIRALDAKFPMDRQDELRVGSDGRAIQFTYEHDRAGLLRARSIVNVMLNDPDSFSDLMRLKHERPKEFTAIMVHVRIELERPAPAEQAAAA